MRRFDIAVLAVSASAVLLAGCDSSEAVDPLAPASSSAARNGASDLGNPYIGDNTRSYTATRIDVRWFDNSTLETGFEVHRSVTGATGVFTHVGSTAPDGVLYSDTGADASVENCYQIRAVRVTGKKTAYSTFSNVVCGPFMPAEPNAPSDFTAAAASEYLINLGWRDNSDNETGFLVERPGAEFKSAAGVQAYADSAVYPAREYCFTVRAVNELVVAAGTMRNWSPTVSVCVTTPPESAPPASAYTISATPFNSNKSQLIIQWTGTRAAPAFRTYRSTDGGATWTLINPEGTYAPFYDSPVASEQQVCYRVVAYNTAGDAAPSSASCITPPAAPSIVAVTIVDAETLEITWSDNSAVEDGYALYAFYEAYSPDNAGYGEYAELVATLPANMTVARAALVAADLWVTTYYYVVSLKDGGESTASNMVSAAGPTH